MALATHTQHIPYHYNTCNNILLITLSLHTYNHSFSSVFVPLPLTIYFVVAKHNLHSDSFEVLNSPHFLTSTCSLGVGLGKNCIPHIRNIQSQPHSVEAHKGQSATSTSLALHFHCTLPLFDYFSSADNKLDATLGPC